MSDYGAPLRHGRRQGTLHGVPIVRSARRHGISDDDIHHAIRNAIRTFEQDDGRLIIVGPARDGSLLEVGLFLLGDEMMIFHAMQCRQKYLPR
jgi:hypothetical protein